MPHKEGLLALFQYGDDFLDALRGLKSGDYRIETVYSPLRLPEAQEIMGMKPSPVRFVTLLGGIVGSMGVLGLAIYSHLSYNLITGGKPVLPWIPWIVVCFEGAILGAVVASVASWVLMGRLPRLHTVKGYDPGFSGDRFGILVACAESEEKRVKEVLAEAGAEEVRHLDW